MCICVLGSGCVLVQSSWYIQATQTLLSPIGLNHTQLAIVLIIIYIYVCMLHFPNIHFSYYHCFHVQIVRQHLYCPNTRHSIYKDIHFYMFVHIMWDRCPSILTYFHDPSITQLYLHLLYCTFMYFLYLACNNHDIYSISVTEDEMKYMK